MKNLKSVFTIFLCSYFLFSATAQTIDIGGVERLYLIHVPENLPEGENVPVVIALHYLGCTASQFEAYTLFSDKADQEGFIVVYPQGIDNSWNAGACCDPAVTHNVDDIGFISELIDTLIEEYPIDSGKVFLAGFSNGAILGYALTGLFPERIAGFASVAGILAMEIDPPSNPVPIIHFHALDDNAVNINGMWGYPSVYDLLDDWKTINNITTEPDTFRNDSRVTGILYPSMDSSANILLYISETGGHQWNLNTRLGTTNSIWEFFSTGINKSYASYDTIQEGPRQRDYKIHIPSRFFTSVDKTTKYPLVLAAHGWNSDAAGMEQMTGFSSKANSEDFFVAYLHYVGPPPDLSWNYFMDEDKPDDIGYSKAVINTLRSRFPIDTSSIFAVGFSDGCGLANRLALETKGLINATGTVGGMVAFDPEVETTPVRMMHLHARNDPAVNYSGVRNGSLNYWLSADNCIIIPDTVYNEQEYLGELWKNAENDTMILFYTLPWNQHAWPVKGQSNMQVSATDMIWDFFEHGYAQPDLPPVNALYGQAKDKNFSILYPVPASDEITIEINSQKDENLIVDVIRPDGKRLTTIDLGYIIHGTYHFEYNVSKLPKGFYLLRIKGSTMQATKQFIIE